ncbi:MAG: DUF5722 domain-containing protein [Lachnospiraceae bacterium]|nr:DUF5722 domain-containing protein [Lachnospiraceae bacterium]
MKKKLTLSICLALLLTLFMGMQASAATTMTIVSCQIVGGNVVVTAAGTPTPSDDGNYYLFALQPYETAIGNRVDFCAVAPQAATMQMATTLDLNTPASKLYARFQIAVKTGGKYVSVSNDFYITNPEAVATTVTAPIPHATKKGITMDWRHFTDVADLGCGYALYELNLSHFYEAGGYPYAYNGKQYNFNLMAVAEYDAICTMAAQCNANLIMAVKNTYNPATLDLIYPTARKAGYNGYAFNISEQGSAEKIEALMHFLAERYSNIGVGTIQSWIIGNEVNNNRPWHYAGNRNVTEFSQMYANEFRLCYNAIKSANAGAKVYINLDQRWLWEDGTPNQYGGKKVLNTFNATIATTGNIDWGLSFHPHSVPLTNCKFWTIPASYRSLNLISHDENTKMINPMNISVLTTYMAKPEFLNPAGGPRSIIISEMLFTSSNRSYATNETVQAAAMTYGYKLMAAQPLIEAVIIHRDIDDAYEIQQGMACGLRNANGTPKLAYEAFKYMDKPGSANSNFALGVIGASSWAQLGLQ